MSRKRWLLLAALFVAGIIFAIYVRVTDHPEEALRNPLVCPDCGKPLARGGDCVWCRTKRRHDEILTTKRPLAGQRQLKLASKLTIAFSISSLAVLVALWPQIIAILQSRSRKNAFRVTRCERCNRKLRYSIASAGLEGVCPACRAVCKFPAIDKLVI